MNCDILKIVRGNDFATQMTITALDAAGNVIEDFSLEESTDVVVKYTLAGQSHNIEAYDYDIEGNNITIQWSDLALGKYGFEIEGKFNGYSWRSAARFIFQIVADNASANIPDGVLVADGVYKLSDWLRLLSGTGGGGKQVQANWTETDTKSPAYIQNKPNLNNYATDTELQQGLATKQDTLVSGENIKTINGESVIGEGNIVLDAESVGAASAEDLQDVADNVGINTTDIATLQEAYDGLTETDVVPVETLPSSGLPNTIYRVAGTSTYSDWMWNGTQPVKLAEYNNAISTIDNVPTYLSNNAVKSGGVYDAIDNIQLELNKKVLSPTQYLPYGKVDKTTGAVTTGSNNGYNLLTPIFVKKGDTFNTDVAAHNNNGFLSTTTSSTVQIGDTLNYIGQASALPYTATEDCYVVIGVYGASLSNKQIVITTPNNYSERIDEAKELSLSYEDIKKISGTQRKKMATAYNSLEIRPATSEDSSIMYFPVESGKSYHVFGIYRCINLSNGGILFTTGDVTTSTESLSASVVVPQTENTIKADVIYTAPNDGYIVFGSKTLHYEIGAISISVFETVKTSYGYKNQNEIKSIENNTRFGDFEYSGAKIVVPKRRHTYNINSVGYINLSSGTNCQGIDIINDRIYQFIESGDVLITQIDSIATPVRETLTFEQGVTSPHFGNVRFTLNSQEDGNKTIYVSNGGIAHTVVAFLADSSWNMTIQKYFDVPLNDVTREYTGYSSTIGSHCALDPENGVGCVFMYPEEYTTGASHDYCDIMVQPFTVDLSGDGDVSSTVVAKEEDVFVIPSCGGRLQDFYYLDGVLFVYSGAYHTMEYPAHISILDLQQKKVVSQIVIPYKVESNCEAQGISIFGNSIIASIVCSSNIAYYKVEIP